MKARGWWVVAVAVSACPTVKAPEAEAPPPVAQEVRCEVCHAVEARAHAGSQHARGQAVWPGGLPAAALTAALPAPFAWTVDGGVAVGEVVLSPRYTLGVAPLVQMAVELPPGRVQVPPVAWLPAEARWVSLDGGGDWRGPAFNWNGGCAPCHATGFVVGARSDGGFVSRWSELSVGCAACHGEARGHLQWLAARDGAGAGSGEGAPDAALIRGASALVQRAGTAPSGSGVEAQEASTPLVSPRAMGAAPEGALGRGPATPGSSRRAAAARAGAAGFNFSLQERVAFDFEDGGAIARAVAVPADVQTNVCADCHARRRPMVDGRLPTASLLDRHEPMLLGQGGFTSDGRAVDEVYEVPSFWMSRMYAAGVRCAHCHEPHSGALRAEGDALCAQCHRLEVFASPAHRGRTTAACVECHMPKVAVMGVDARRDHRFPRQLDGGVAAFEAAFGQSARAPALLVALAGDVEASAYVRASALALLTPPVTRPMAEVVRRASVDASPLVRLGAAQAVVALGLPVGGLAEDRARAVRVAVGRGGALENVEGVVEALRVALPGADEAVPEAERNAAVAAARRLPRALVEAVQAERINGSRGEAYLTLAALSRRFGDEALAERQLRQGLALEPGFAPLTLELADVLRALGRDDEAGPLLSALRAGPLSAQARQALGLWHLRRGEKQQGLAELAAAAPSGPQFTWTWLLALRAQNPQGADRAASLAVRRSPESRDLLLLWALFARDDGRVDEARRRLGVLAALAPDDPEVLSLAQELGGP